MNNDNPIRLINENGAPKEYGRIPDLWHVAQYLASKDRKEASDAVLEVWHMAHDLKAVIEKQDQARIVEVTSQDGLPWPGKTEYPVGES